MHRSNLHYGKRLSAALVGCGGLLIASPGIAQTTTSEGLEEIVVTAQKREQLAQDVPIAITAISRAALEANRITSVMDLNAQAPNLTLRQTAGGIGVASFSMRGSVSYGSVPGQDKAISTYIDGVYIGSSYGSAFELPDLERIEVLRGPQGTLFGRNATAGAINVVTRDPSGQFGVKQIFSGGNYAQFRSSTRVELPAWGPFSASVSFTHDQRNGDMNNLGAGQVWDRTGPGSGQTLGVSPRTLGDQDTNAVFAALKFEPIDSFKVVYKFDWDQNHFTPEGNAGVALTPEALGPFGAPLALAYAANPQPLANQHRPDAVNNSFTTPGFQRVVGHNLTSTLLLTDHLTATNIAEFRQSYIYANSDISGIGGLAVTPAVAASLAAISGFPPGSFDGLVGSPYVVVGSSVANTFQQWSDELQLNYDSRLVTLTAGALFYHSISRTGAPYGLGGLEALSPAPGGKLYFGQKNFSDNTAKSTAGYTQAEVHITSQLDAILGFRDTHDVKTGVGYNYDAATATQLAFPFSYDGNRPSYLAGINYKPREELLLYAKFSTAFISGGSVSGIGFAPETVKSWEGGIKSQLLDNRLRANLAVFKADYKNVQGVGLGLTLIPSRPELGTVVVREGDLAAKGVEFELEASPVRGVNLGASLGYTNSDEYNLNPSVFPPGSTSATLRPKWTSDLSAQYTTLPLPLFNQARVMLRLDGNWRSQERTTIYNSLPAAYDSILFSDADWILNGRIALQGMKLAGGTAEIAAWVRNLTDSDKPAFPVYYTFSGSSTYDRARTYGVDLIYEY